VQPVRDRARDALGDARAVGLRVEIADLGDWSPAALVSEYDPAARAVRVNARVLERVRSERGACARDELLQLAVAHELYHHGVAAGEIPPAPDRVSEERAARTFALERCATVPITPDGK
jgi:hypothetical protein